MDFIDEVAGAIGQLADRVAPSVVRIGGGWRSGSGVVIADGAVVTNAHNVRAERMTVVFSDGRRADAELAGLDVDGDLAVLSVDTAAAPPLDWAEQTPALGSAVFAVTANGGGPRVTLGFVSSVAQAFRGPRGRRISGSLEHTAPLAPGSSGSALVDRQGRFVGLNTNRLGGGFYLALPADETLRGRIGALQRGESVERPRLGVGIAPSRAARRLRRAVGLPELDGVLVREVEADSPAERAGILEGDLLTDAAGRPLREPDDLYDALGSVSVGENLELRVVRGSEERTVEVRFAPAADDESGGSADPVH
jgi:serine protease Do